MFNQISYNVVIERFKVFADGHFLIRRFSHGQVDVTDIDKDQLFPWMHVAPVDVRLETGSRVYSFDVIFAEMPRDKEDATDYQREVISDCVRLCEDLVNEIANGHVVFGQDVELETGSTITPFIAEYTHTLCGATLAISISVPNDYSACDIPANWSIGGGGSSTPPAPSAALILRVNDVDNVNQTVLDLTAGANVTITDLGDGRVKFDATGDLGTNWGTIGGVLSAQLDLQGALDLKADISSLGAVAFSNDYNDLDNLPTIPDATGLVPYTGATSDVSLGNHNVVTNNGTFDSIMRPDLFGVENAAGNQYSTLEYNVMSIVNSTTGESTQVTASGITFPDASTQTTAAVPQVNSDWNAITGVEQILNKPTLATVATSGSYLDLTDQPTIGTGTVTSVDATISSPANAAFAISGTPVTTTGTIKIVAQGTSSQYIDGTAALRTFPAIPKTLTDLISGTTKGDLIEWNGTTWIVRAALALDDLVGVDTPTPTNGQVLTYNATTKLWYAATPVTGGGTVTSVGLTMPSAFAVTGSPVTGAGTFGVTGAGTSSQYVDGTGALQTMPTGLPPTGTAGGDLTGTYPNPTVHRVHGIDMQNGTPSANDVWIYGGSPAKWQHQHINASIVDNDSAVTGTTVKDALNHLNTTKVEANAGITAATKTKITYDTKGFVTAGSDLSASDIPSGIDAAKIGSGTVSNTEFGYLDGVTSALQSQIDSKQTTLVSGTTIKTLEGQSLLGSGNIDLTKSDVGLSNVDNTSDASKPISTATQTALNAKQDTLVSGTSLKTVNSTSLLGSGDVAVQATLVSGTNIKTVNSTSLLGSGNITTGTVTSIVASSPLTGGTITGSGTIGISDAAADGTTKGAAAFTAADFNSASGVISLDYANGQKASASQPGFVTSTDWSTFNGKQDALVSGTNIKTINSISLLGSGNIPIATSDSTIFTANPNATQGAASTGYWAITGSLASSATENFRNVIMPVSGTLKNLYVRNGTTQSGTGTMVFTLRKNGADTAMTVTFSNTDGASATKSDTTNTVSVVAGDLICIKGVNNAPGSASGNFVSFTLLLER